MIAVGGVVSAEAWPLIDYRNGAWFGGRVRAVERLASLVKPDTRVVPADGPLLTGRDVMRQRDIYDELFVTMIGYMNIGLRRRRRRSRQPAEAVRSRVRRSVGVPRRRVSQHADRVRAGLRWEKSCRYPSASSSYWVSRGFCSSVAANAHHSFSALFQMDTVAEVQGQVTDVEWVNPHVKIHIRDGAGETWEVEAGR